MKKLLALLLLLPFMANGEENIVQCTESREFESVEQYHEACMDIAGVQSFPSCIDSALKNDLTEEEAGNFCNDFYRGYDLAQFINDRPTDFFDIMAKPESGALRSFGCSVTKDEDGENEYNSHVMIMSDDNEILGSSEAALKAMVHIYDEKNYAEVIYGNTIYPITENRFFTNILNSRLDNIVAGFVDEDIEEPKGGTDRGPIGGGWIIDGNENQLIIISGQYDTKFHSNCKWQEDFVDEEDVQEG